MNLLLNILQLFQKYKGVVSLIAGVVLGILLGAVIFWGVVPPQAINTAPTSLRGDFRDQYLTWVAEYYVNTDDLQGARTKLGEEYWIGGTEALVGDLNDLSGRLTGEAANNARALAQALSTTSPQPPEQPTEDGGAEGGAGLPLQPVALVCGVGLLIVAIVVLIFYVLKRRQASGTEKQPKTRGVDVSREYDVGEQEAPSWGAEGAPLAQFVTSYTLGDDHYDPSFSIEMENGEFMGECGVGISETIGVGAPNKVTACEVWLFDKNDIRTVTTVLMSEYAYQDEALRAKLAPKGEPMLAKVGETLELETKTLRVQARIVEAIYGAGDLPPNSFFERLTVELAAWVKTGPESDTASDADVLSYPVD